MTLLQIVKPTGPIAIIALLGFASLSIISPRVQAESSETDSVVQIGFALAPVKLNLDGKDPALVGKGSYIVNTRLCNNCHASPDLTGPTGIWAPDHNPFFGQPKMESEWLPRRRSTVSRGSGARAPRGWPACHLRPQFDARVRLRPM